MKEFTKEGIKLVAASLVVFAVTVFYLCVGLGLMKMTGTGNNVMSLVVSVSGAIHLVGSVCTFVIGIEMLCNGVRSLKGKRN